MGAKAGGIPSLIRDGETGYLVEPGNVSQRGGVAGGGWARVATNLPESSPTRPPSSSSPCLTVAVLSLPSLPPSLPPSLSLQMNVFNDCVRKLIEDKEHRDEMGAAVRAEAELWGWEASTTHLRDVQYALALENYR